MIHVQGISSQGGHVAVVAGIGSSNVLIESYPACTVTVYNTGTTDLTAIYSDDGITPKANPFTADDNANWEFYVEIGVYDIRFSGGDIVTPFTLSAYPVGGPGGGTGTFISTAYDSLSDAVTQIGSTQGTLLIVGASFPSGASCTVPSTLRLAWASIGTLLLTTGHVVTINSDTSDYPLRKIFYNAVAAQGTIRFTSNYVTERVLPEWWGAIADRVGTSGTDSTSAIQAAIVALETLPAPGILYLTGGFLVKSLSDQCVLVSQNITIEGVNPTLSGFFATTDTPDTVDILRYKPAGHPASEGFTIRNFALGASDDTTVNGFWKNPLTQPSARHCLVLDDTLLGTPPAQGIRRFTAEHIWFLATNSTAGTGRAILGTSTNASGNPQQSVIKNCFVWNGIKFPAAGDTISFEDNMFLYFNAAIDIDQLSGATTISIVDNNITSYGGVRLGSNVLAARVVGNIVELSQPSVVGSNGAILDLDGVITAYVYDNLFISLLGSPLLDGIRVSGTQVFIDKNWLDVQATKANIKQVGSSAIIEGVNIRGAMGGSITDTVTDTTVFYDPVLQRKNGIAVGVLPETNLFQGFITYEGSTFIGGVRSFGSTYAVVAQRNWTDIINDIAGAGVTITTGATPTIKVSVNETGLTSLFKGADVASASAIVPTGNVFHVTGTTTITSITSTGITAGTTITIIFDGALTFTDGSNLVLAGNFVTTANDTITLVWEGSAWYELCRSVN